MSRNKNEILLSVVILFSTFFYSASTWSDETKQSSSLRKADTEIVVPMSVDVDGAPTSYGPDNNKALDYELNAHKGAKKSGAIVGYRTDKFGKPIIQRDGDPAPGFYVSETHYTDKNNSNENDPRRYVNAAEINYTVLANNAKKKGVAPGDFCVVHAIKKNKTVFAIVGDTGHSNGAEGSLALLQRLGFQVKNGKSVDEPITDIVVRYFAKSNPSKQFFFNQFDLDNAANMLNLDTDFSSFH
jgi:hypothetical protein